MVEKPARSGHLKVTGRGVEFRAPAVCTHTREKKAVVIPLGSHAAGASLWGAMHLVLRHDDLALGDLFGYVSSWPPALTQVPAQLARMDALLASGKTIFVEIEKDVFVS